jgi:hypothetical protein
MIVLNIPDSLADKYHGCGHAIVAILGGEIVDLIYVRDVLPDYEDGDLDALRIAIGDDRMGPTVRYLSGLGEVSVGMCSRYEFVVL